MSVGDVPIEAQPSFGSVTATTPASCSGMLVIGALLLSRTWTAWPNKPARRMDGTSTAFLVTEGARAAGAAPGMVEAVDGPASCTSSKEARTPISTTSRPASKRGARALSRFASSPSIRSI